MQNSIQISFSSNFKSFKVNSFGWTALIGTDTASIMQQVEPLLEVGELRPSEYQITDIAREVNRVFRLMRSGVYHGFAFNLSISDCFLGVIRDQYIGYKQWNWAIVSPKYNFEFLIFSRQRGLNPIYKELLGSEIQKFDNASATLWGRCGFASKALEVKSGDTIFRQLIGGI